MNRPIISLLLAAAVCGGALAQNSVLTLHKAIEVAQRQSFSAVVARLNFLSGYWNYRSYKAEFLPSINLSSNLMQYNHSTVEARDPETGELFMVNNNTLSNSLTFSVDQNIAALGGTLAVQSYLYRLDQFDYHNRIYNSQPIRIVYNQPLFAFNELKWKKRTEPLKYDKAKRDYLERLEAVAANVVEYYFATLQAQNDAQQAMANLKDRERLFAMSQERLTLGTINRSDLLQMELSLENARMEVRSKELALKTAAFSLLNYLMIPGADVKLLPPDDVSDLELNQEDVVNMALQRSSFVSNQTLDRVQQEEDLARAKAARGVQLQLNADIGFDRTANELRAVYKGLENSQIVGLSVSIPLFDWGVRKGRVRMAEANLEAIRTSQAQDYEQYVQDLRTQVLKFNMQKDLCAAALRAREIATERYEIMRRRFEAGGVTVTELNTAWQESETARAQYISQLNAYWGSYYTLRKATLYDWLHGQELNVRYDDLIKK